MRNYKLGMWGARMDNSGLGQQTMEFVNHMNPVKTVVVDISVLEANPQRVMQQYPERYTDNPIGDVKFIHGIPDEGDIRQFLTDLDVVFIAESAYNMGFYAVAREMGVKVAVQYNWEFWDWTDNSMWFQHMPDLFIAPSSWHFDEADAWIKKGNEKYNRNTYHVYLHCPVNRDKITRRHIETATSFVHIAGRPADHDRNGTFTFLQAISLSDGELRGIVYTQDANLRDTIRQEYPSVEVKFNVHDYCDIYKKGSVLVIPRKYGGNCLPMNEALAAGMPVIMSKVSPQTDFLPDRWLVTAKKTDIQFAPRFPVDVYEVTPHDLLLRMKWFHSLSNKDMRQQSDTADELADDISWDNMAPAYTQVLEALCLL